MITVACTQCGKEKTIYPSQEKPRNFCDKNCLGAYRTEHYTGTRAAHWQGGTSTDEDGRVEWHMPWHHRANDKGYVFRYVVVAELMLQRPLLPDEVVHHDDEDPSNDHPTNLIVCANQAEHARIHGKRRSPEMMARMRSARKTG